LSGFITFLIPGVAEVVIKEEKKEEEEGPFNGRSSHSRLSYPLSSHSRLSYPPFFAAKCAMFIS